MAELGMILNVSNTARIPKSQNPFHPLGGLMILPRICSKLQDLGKIMNGAGRQNIRIQNPESSIRERCGWPESRVQNHEASARILPQNSRIQNPESEAASGAQNYGPESRIQSDERAVDDFESGWVRIQNSEFRISKSPLSGEKKQGRIENWESCKGESGI